MSSVNTQKKEVAAAIKQHPAPTNLNTNKAPDINSVNFLAEKTNAVTINFPFTTIPGLPALSTVLAKIDKKTSQDLGFSIKASATVVPDGHGGKNLNLSLDYAGLGVMSPKFNVQYSPDAVKMSLDGVTKKPHWGYSASLLAAPVGLVHERLGLKTTLSNSDGPRNVSEAAEAAYQKSSSFKPISTVTGGYFFGDSAIYSVPAEYVPTLKRIQAASPDLDELKVIAERIAPSIPAIPIGELIANMIDNADNAIHSLMNDSKLDEIDATLKINQEDETRNKQAHTSDIRPPNEVRSTYPVQQNDTLEIIGKKTGHPWIEIYALNRNILNNNPHNIHPGQELLLPEVHDHAALMNHPVVEARVKANIAKQAIHARDIEPSNEEKATYTVRAGDTLDIIGQKTKHTSKEIYALNKNILNNSPDKIYPSQELLIPDDHAALICHPVVQARIQAIKAKQQEAECTP